jgi:hypothetical protein
VADDERKAARRFASAIAGGLSSMKVADAGRPWSRAISALR